MPAISTFQKSPQKKWGFLLFREERYNLLKYLPSEVFAFKYYLKKKNQIYKTFFFLETLVFFTQ